MDGREVLEWAKQYMPGFKGGYWQEDLLRRMYGMSNIKDQIWYMAECQQCTPILPQPFQNVIERDFWERKHRSETGHDVKVWFEAKSIANDAQLASQFMRAMGMEPTADAVEQLYAVFVPCLRLMCEREQDHSRPDGGTWKASGWRGSLYMTKHKMERIWHKAWYKGEFAEAEVHDMINYAGFYLRSDRSKPWGEWGDPDTITVAGKTTGEAIAARRRESGHQPAKNGPPFTDYQKRSGDYDINPAAKDTPYSPRHGINPAAEETPMLGGRRKVKDEPQA